MEHSTLEELLNILEKDRKIRIFISFQEGYENAMMACGGIHRAHSAPVCKHIMKKRGGYQECYRCRCVVERLVTRKRKAVDGYCPCSVYEYSSPVIYQDKVAAVISISNILLGTEEQNLRIGKMVDPKLLHTMDTGYSREDCCRTAGLVGSYITLLLETYGAAKKGADPLEEKVKQYVFENYMFGFSASDIAAAFGYSEKYLGRVFKEQSGHSIKEYCNLLRVNEAKRLLLTTNLSVTEIAGLTGFNNTTYFNYVFGNHTAMSPTQYRESATGISG